MNNKSTNKMNYKGIEITIKSTLADVAFATMFQTQVCIENGSVVNKQVPVELKGTLSSVKNEISRFLKNGWAK